jgi:hypothetical protein
MAGERPIGQVVVAKGNSVTLPSGVTVTLIGMTVDTELQNLWWQADGNIIDTQSRLKEMWGYNGKKARIVLFRIDHISDKTRLNLDFNCGTEGSNEQINVDGFTADPVFGSSSMKMWSEIEPGPESSKVPVSIWVSVGIAQYPFSYTEPSKN